MRSTTLLLPAALTGLAASTQQAQQPLGNGLADKVKGWFDAATSLLPTNIASSAVSSISGSSSSSKKGSDATSPTGSAANLAKLRDVTVPQVNWTNWRDVVRADESAVASAPRTEWLVYVRGANQTCFDKCEKTDQAWEVSFFLLL